MQSNAQPTHEWGATNCVRFDHTQISVGFDKAELDVAMVSPSSIIRGVHMGKELGHVVCILDFLHFLPSGNLT